MLRSPSLSAALVRRVLRVLLRGRLARLVLLALQVGLATQDHLEQVRKALLAILALRDRKVARAWLVPPAIPLQALLVPRPQGQQARPALGLQGHRGRRVIKGTQGPPDQQDLQARWGLRRTQVQQDLRVLRETPAPRALPLIQVQLDLLDPSVLLAQPGLLARHSLAQQDQLVLPRPLAGMRV